MRFPYQLPTPYSRSWKGPRWLKQPIVAAVITKTLRPLDKMMGVIFDGIAGAYPGLGTPSAAQAIGQSRGLLQGPSEPNAKFFARCLLWLWTWANAGSDWVLALQIQSYLCGSGNLGAGVYPIVKVVARNGVTTTVDASQSVTFSTTAWNWDQVGGWVFDIFHTPTTVQGWWSDLWIVVQDPFTHYSSFSDPNWLAAWGSQAATIDSIVPQSVVQEIYGLVRTFRGGHTYVRNIVFTPSPASFVPDGKYGNASVNVSGVQTTHRVATNAYWDPPGGG